MTAEIAILNRGAVALASDSAVTIDTPTGPKIYDSANKLFALIKGQPVGVMIYDSADHLGVPWETIVKAYRMARKGWCAPSLQSYADDFLDFVAASPDLIPSGFETAFLLELAGHRAQAIVNATSNKVAEHFGRGARRLSQRQLRQFIREAIEEQEAAWHARVDGPWAPSLPINTLKRRHRAAVDTAIDRRLQNLPATVAHRAAIRSLTFDSLGKIPVAADRLPVDPRSGIVIAGFGEREFFPRLISYDIYGSVDGKLRAVVDQRVEISPDNPAVIAPFAQREMVDGFMTGINPQTQVALLRYLEAVTGTFPPAVLDLVQRHVGTIDPSVATTLGGSLTSLILMVSREFEQHLSKVSDLQIQPILDSVNFLPKDELAAMAESLVNLTSLKRRISIDDPQTVGGPVDVAVISRGDGLVWIKRKHYFSQQLNPTWASTHAES